MIIISLQINLCKVFIKFYILYFLHKNDYGNFRSHLTVRCLFNFLCILVSAFGVTKKPCYFNIIYPTALLSGNRKCQQFPCWHQKWCWDRLYKSWHQQKCNTPQRWSQGKLFQNRLLRKKTFWRSARILQGFYSSWRKRKPSCYVSWWFNRVWYVWKEEKQMLSDAIIIIHLYWLQCTISPPPSAFPLSLHKRGLGLPSGDVKCSLRNVIYFLRKC